MNKLMPYFRLMKKATIIMILITLSIVITNDGREILTGFKHSLVEDGHLLFKSQIYTMTAILMFIQGIFLSYKQFNIAMNIKADRKSYIKATIISTIVLGLGFAIFTVLWEFILKFIVETVSGKPAVILSDSAYFVDTIVVFLNSLSGMGASTLVTFSDLSIGMFIMDILGQFLTLLMYSSVGLLLGSILYRLKKSTSVIIFLVIPTIVITLGLTFVILNTDLFTDYISINLGKILFFIMNINIRLIIKLLTIIISLISSVLLLKNAPIKEYAHDLI
ncbi:hypothetical protein [Romboutsia sp. 13368]|uniref:hypothetical protein n=1 Tax=Romboutsia sp. 13368 TaxID=2708053 RepID=UPI0025E860A3|nr:hypothetical protein [Romboutsia sp. 13368]